MSQGRQRIVAGVTLIALGIAFLALQWFEGISTSALLLLVGAGFLGAYLYQREYGFLVPAGILLGLGLGKAFKGTWSGEPVLLGLGLGFVSIFVIGLIYERNRNWWPLIPGGVLIVIGLPDTARVIRTIFDNWPVILIVVGILILFGAFRRGGAAARPDPPGPAPPGPAPPGPAPPAPPPGS